MGIFDLFHAPDINRGVEEYQSTPGAVLLDVRTEEEYAEGHIPGSVNLPLDRLEAAAAVLPDPSAPIFVHCYSGARSRQAAGYLQRIGYETVKNIGGIAAYHGKLE